MTDEGMRGDPMSAVEVAETMRNFAVSLRVFFLALKEEGFTESEALRLAAAQVHGASGGKLEGT